MEHGTEKKEEKKKKSFKCLGIFAFLALIVATLLPFYWGYFQNDRDRMDKVLKSLLVQEKRVEKRPKIAIGYGACVDLFVDGHHLFSDLSPPSKGKHHKQIKSQHELLEVYAYFFAHGAAAERFISEDQLFEMLVNKARQLKDRKVALGGNAPVMANRFAKEGAEVLLAAKMSKKFRNTVENRVTVASTDDLDKDDVHLILEYKRNEKWGHYSSPRANRFIVHSDVNNPTVSSLEDFGTMLDGYNPNLLVVGGLQMMDNFPFKQGERVSRLSKIRQQMSSQLPDTRIHFEMASFVDESLLQELTEYVIPYADSLGMNEQELPNLRSMLVHGNVSFVSDSNPRTAVVLDEMRDLYRLLSGNKQSQGMRPLTRLHVHTLAYQAILVTHGSAWKNTRYAAAKASLTANRHVCASNWVDVSKAFLLMDDSFSTSTAAGSHRVPFNDERPVACWTETVDGVPENANPIVQICLAPNLVCSEAKQTAGGGDNISAAGLVLQV